MKVCIGLIFKEPMVRGPGMIQVYIPDKQKISILKLWNSSQGYHIAISLKQTYKLRHFL